MKPANKFDLWLLRNVFRHMPWLTPNMLTALRIPAPLVVVVLYSARYDLTAWTVFALAAITDLFDGSLARSRGPQTKWGKHWDQVADKWLVNCTIAVFIGRWVWDKFDVQLDWSTIFLVAVPFVLVLIRDWHVNTARQAKTIRFTGVLRSAQWKTTVQMFAAGCLLLAHQSLLFSALAYSLIPISTGLALYSWYWYMSGIQRAN